MKLNKGFMTGLIGLALMAAPITAAAQEQNNRGRSDSHPAAQAQSHASAAHSERAQARPNVSEHRSAPEAANRNASRETRSARTETRQAEPQAATRTENRAERNAAAESHRGATTASRTFNEHNDRNIKTGAPVTANEERGGNRSYNNSYKGSYSYNGSNDHNYGNRYYRNYGGHEYDHDREYAAGGWVMPEGYSGGACAWAQHLRNVYRHDEYTGHPAAASDLLWQLHRAERNCGGARYGYNW
ncbi:MAG TPA: hypothetical protein VN865_05010 [Candidatus Acidoferrales bacterium]|nr:hypothetical protein [Candidatus Acidoferrales bacterium]